MRLRYRARLLPGGLQVEPAPFSGGLTVEPDTLFPWTPKESPHPAQRRAGTGPREAEAGEVTPRLIISCNSSGFDERANAISKVINLAKYAFTRLWLNVCMPVC